MSQVVHAYGDVCQTIGELAVETGAPISTDDFPMLNHCLDEAIASPVTEYGRERQQSGLERETARESERLGFVEHELRNLMNTALVAFEVLKSGNVGVAGSTGAVLYRSIVGARDLIGRSLAEVRPTQGGGIGRPFRPPPSSTSSDRPHGWRRRPQNITFVAMPVEDHVAIEGDRQILAAVVMNLLQNAFKFTRPRTTVTLRVDAGAERVLIEIEDECGGLPSGNINDLFRPVRAARGRSFWPGAWSRLLSIGNGGEPRPSMRATCLTRAASLRSICRGSRFRPPLQSDPSRPSNLRSVKRRTTGCARHAGVCR